MESKVTDTYGICDRGLSVVVPEGAESMSNVGDKTCSRVLC